MAILDCGGDSGAYVKYSGGNIVIGAGGSDKVTVTSQDTTIAGDINAAGGYQMAHTFTRYNLLQTAGVFMTSSVAILSSSTIGFTSSFHTRIPMLRAGSVRGISLITQNCTVKSGSLSGTVMISGVFAGAVGMSTGTLAVATFAKDLYPFNAGTYIEVGLTATVGDAGYFTDLPLTSGSWQAVVVVEF